MTFETTDGLGLMAWFVAASAPSPRVTVLVFNGNAGNRAQRGPLATALHRHGFQVLLVDYRGYGGNPGAPTESGLAADSRAARVLRKYYIRAAVRADTNSTCRGSDDRAGADTPATAQQIREAFPWDQTPRYLLRDRDAIYGADVGHRLRGFGIDEVVSAPKAPWQNPLVERVIGSIRRECLDHVIVRTERSLRRTLGSYLDYYHRWRTHLSLDKDTPEPRPIQPPERGAVIERARVGGLHHLYERWAA